MDEPWQAHPSTPEEILDAFGTRAPLSGRLSSFNLYSPQPRKWPAPLAEAAFYGLAGEVVRTLEPHTEADPAAILLQFLCAFGNAAGRHSYVQVEGDKHPPQIWPVLVGETAKGRKGTSWSRIRQLFAEASPDWLRTRVVSGLSSGEGSSGRSEIQAYQSRSTQASARRPLPTREWKTSDCWSWKRNSPPRSDR